MRTECWAALHNRICEGRWTFVSSAWCTVQDLQPAEPSIDILHHKPALKIWHLTCIRSFKGWTFFEGEPRLSSAGPFSAARTDLWWLGLYPLLWGANLASSMQLSWSRPVMQLRQTYSMVSGDAWVGLPLLLPGQHCRSPSHQAITQVAASKHKLCQHHAAIAPRATTAVMQ